MSLVAAIIIQSSLHCLTKSKVLKINQSLSEISPNRPFIRPFRHFQVALSTFRPSTQALNSIQLAIPTTSSFLRKDQQPSLATWPTTASPPHSAPALVMLRARNLMDSALWSTSQMDFGFAAAAGTKTTRHIALRSAAIVNISIALLVTNIITEL